MNPNLNTPFTYIVGALVALVIAASCNLDGPSEADAAQAVADDAAQVQRTLATQPELLRALHDTQPGSEAHRAAVADLCYSTKGRDAQLLTLPDGSMACRRAKVQVAAQGAQ